MLKLRAHFDGHQIVLDEPPPAVLRPNMAVEVLIPQRRETALSEWEAFSREFWDRPLPTGFTAVVRSWRREDLYERGKRVS